MSTSGAGAGGTDDSVAASSPAATSANPTTSPTEQTSNTPDTSTTPTLGSSTTPNNGGGGQTSTTTSPNSNPTDTNTSNNSPTDGTTGTATTSPGGTSNTSTAPNTNTGLASSPSSTSHSTTMVLTQASTTSVESTSVGTSNGVIFTTVITTESVIPAGATITASSSNDSSSSSSGSSSHTGAIVGGVVGGVAGLLALIGIIFFFLRRKRRFNDLDAFDGNFDPDRIVRPGAGRGYTGGGTLPNIGVDDEGGRRPEMQELFDDDGTGGRLNASTVGGGVVTPYQLFNPSNQQMGYAHPGSLGMGSPPLSGTLSPGSASGHGHGYGGRGTPPLSASSSEGFNPAAVMAAAGFGAGAGAAAAAAGGDWRHPSPGPSLGQQYTGGTDQYHNQAAGYHANQGQGTSGAPSVVSSSSGGYIVGGGMTPGRLAKEREAFGMPMPMPSPGLAGGSSSQAPSAYAVGGPERARRNSGVPSVSDRSAGGVGGAGLTVANPDNDGNEQRFTGKSPTGPSTSARGPVLVHQDGGRVPVEQGGEGEGPDEIPPTYESLLASGAGSSGAAAGQQRAEKRG